MSSTDVAFADRREDAVIGSELLRNAILLAKGYQVPEKDIPRRVDPPVAFRCEVCARFKAPSVGRVAQIQATVARHYGIQSHYMTSDQRAFEISHPRQIAMYLAAQLTSQSLVAIGKKFRRDHTTVIHAIKVVKKRISDSPQTAEDVRVLREALEG